MVYVETGRKELKTKWPHTSGLIAGTTKQTGRQMNLVPQGLLGVKSTLLREDKLGF